MAEKLTKDRFDWLASEIAKGNFDCANDKSLGVNHVLDILIGELRARGDAVTDEFSALTEKLK